MTVKSVLKRNITATWIAHFTSMFIAIYLMPYILKVLGDDKYGVWLFINSIAGYSALLYLGMGGVVARFVSTHHAKEEWNELNEVVSVVFSVYLAMGALALAIAGTLAWLAPHSYDWGIVNGTEVRWVILILGLNITLSLIGSVYGGVLMGLQRFDLVQIYGISACITKLILTLLFLQYEWGLLILAVIFLCMTIIENIGPIYLAYKELPTLTIRMRNWSKRRLKTCFSFSTFSFIDSLAWRMIYATDTIVIGLMMGKSIIVPYFIASRLSNFISTPILHIGSISMPQAGALHASEEKKQLHELIYRSVGLAFVLTCGFLIGSYYFGESVIRTWVGTGYEDAYDILLILLGAQVIAIPMNIMRRLLFGVGLIKLPALMYLSEAICNLGLTLLLIPHLGLKGVAYGTAIPILIIELFVILPYAIKHLDLKPHKLVEGAIQPYIIPLVALGIYSWSIAHAFPDSFGWVKVFAIAAGGGIVLLAALFWSSCKAQIKTAIGI